MSDQTPNPEPQPEPQSESPAERIRDHRFKKGGDPRRCTSGHLKSWGLTAFLRLFLNGRYTEYRLRCIAKNPKALVAKRSAALCILRSLENPDLADFSELLTGKKTLKEMRDEGYQTDHIKKLKVRNRKVKVADGEYEEFVEGEIELFDRAGINFDRVADRTEGTPKQTIENKTDVTVRVESNQMPAFFRRRSEVAEAGNN